MHTFNNIHKMQEIRVKAYMNDKIHDVVAKTDLQMEI